MISDKQHPLLSSEVEEHLPYPAWGRGHEPRAAVSAGDVGCQTEACCVRHPWELKGIVVQKEFVKYLSSF